MFEVGLGESGGGRLPASLWLQPRVVDLVASTEDGTSRCDRGASLLFGNHSVVGGIAYEDGASGGVPAVTHAFASRLRFRKPSINGGG